MKITLNPANENDLPAIADMAKEIWNRHYPAIIGQVQVDYMLNKMYSYDALRKQMSEGQLFFLINDEENMAGYLSVSSENDNKNLFIHKFYIYSDRQKQGIGAAVFEKILSLFPQSEEIRLQVNRQNHTAINFYFKVGFTIERVADFDIGDGYFMNDFIMLWKRKNA